MKISNLLKNCSGESLIGSNLFERQNVQFQCKKYFKVC